MPQLLIPLILLLAGLLALNMFLRANPGTLATSVRKTAGIALLLLSLLLLSRGLLPLAGMTFLAAILAFALPNIMAGQPGGRSSRVRTSILSMQLDHESGDLDGDVIGGQFAGRKLSELEIEQLMQLRAECLLAGDQSARLLDAYLDRLHAGWRENYAQGDADQGASSGALTVEQAYEILGLQPGASRAQINKAHRDLMKKFHPDHGGSEFLAQQINEARDLLLSLL